MKRATLVFFDEAGFSSEEIITISEAFATQNSDFSTSVDESFNRKAQFKKNPTQLIFASSASSTDTIFYQRYKEYAKKMIIGDNKYFVADIPCDIPLNPLLDGEPIDPLLKKEQVDNALATSREKALREYYNKFTTDGGESQPIKRSVIGRNSINTLPVLYNETNQDKFVFAFDPARTYDNSICSVMRIVHDEKIGYYGEIVNCVSFADLGKKKKTPMKSPEQLKYFKQMLLDYNGTKNPDYENILGVLFDSGAGGGGISSFADNLLEDWVDENGITHRGIIDLSHDQYKDDASMYPNAVNILQLISPKKMKVQMMEQLIELLGLDLIKFPREYDGKEIINIAKDVEEDNNKERKIIERRLTMEEIVALSNIDIMKEETYAIHRFRGANGTISYDLPKDKQKNMGDDRFYTLLMLAHFLYQLRRKDTVVKSKPKVDWSKAPNLVSAVSF